MLLKIIESACLLHHPPAYPSFIPFPSIPPIFLKGKVLGISCTNSLIPRRRQQYFWNRVKRDNESC